MAPLSWAPLHIVESKKELVVNKAKQADENELAEFTMSMATWCAARGALFAIAGRLSRNHVLLNKFSNSFSQNGVDDLGRTVVGSKVA